MPVPCDYCGGKGVIEEKNVPAIVGVAVAAVVLVAVVVVLLI